MTSKNDCTNNVESVHVMPKVIKHYAKHSFINCFQKWHVPHNSPL